MMNKHIKDRYIGSYRRNKMKKFDFPQIFKPIVGMTQQPKPSTQHTLGLLPSGKNLDSHACSTKTLKCINLQISKSPRKNIRDLTEKTEKSQSQGSKNPSKKNLLLGRQKQIERQKTENIDRVIQKEVLKQEKKNFPYLKQKKVSYDEKKSTTYFQVKKRVNEPSIKQNQSLKKTQNDTIPQNQSKKQNNFFRNPNTNGKMKIRKVSRQVQKVSKLQIKEQKKKQQKQKKKRKTKYNYDEREQQVEQIFFFDKPRKINTLQNIGFRKGSLQVNSNQVRFFSETQIIEKQEESKVTSCDQLLIKKKKVRFRQVSIFGTQESLIASQAIRNRSKSFLQKKSFQDILFDDDQNEQRNRYFPSKIQKEKKKEEGKRAFVNVYDELNQFNLRIEKRKKIDDIEEYDIKKPIPIPLDVEKWDIEKQKLRRFNTDIENNMIDLGIRFSRDWILKQASIK